MKILFALLVRVLVMLIRDFTSLMPFALLLFFVGEIIILTTINLVLYASDT